MSDSVPLIELKCLEHLFVDVVQDLPRLDSVVVAGLLLHGDHGLGVFILPLLQNEVKRKSSLKSQNVGVNTSAWWKGKVFDVHLDIDSVLVEDQELKEALGSWIKVRETIIKKQSNLIFVLSSDH